MPDKILELQATMTDRVSDTLRQIKRSVDDLNKSTVSLTTQRKELQALGQELTNLGRAGGGIQNTTKHLRDFSQQFKEISNQFRETGKSVKEMVLPAFEEMGFGITSVGAAAALLVKTMKDVAGESQKVQNIAKLTGFDPGSVAAMQTGVRAFGVSANQVMSTMGNIAKQMDLIAGTPGGGGSSLLTRARQTMGLQGFAQDLTNIARNPNITIAERNMQGVARTLGELQRIQSQYGSQRAANIAEQLGLDPETILLLNQGVNVLGHWREMQRRMGEEIDPAKLAQWGIAQDKLAASLEHIRRAVTGALITDVTRITTAVADFIDVNNEQISDGIVKVVTDLGNAANAALPNIILMAQWAVKAGDALNRYQSYVDRAGKAGHDFLVSRGQSAFNMGTAAPAGTGLTYQGGSTAGPGGVFLPNPWQNAFPTGQVSLPPNAWGGGAAASSQSNNVRPSGQAFPGMNWNWLSGAFSMGRPAGATGAQPFSDQFVNPMGLQRGSLGTGNIATGWRRSTGIEDERSNEEIVADDEARKGTDDNTTATRDNTDQLRKLIDVLNRGHGIATMDLTGGGGAGGMGGGYGAGQGPMYRPGIGPGSRASPGVNNAPGGGHHTVPVAPPPSVRVPSGTHPGATVTRGPAEATPTPVPPTSIPAPNLMPGLQDGGVIRNPATLVDNATGQALAQVAEKGAEAVVPLDQSEIRGRTTVAALERNQLAQDAIGRFTAAFPNVSNPKTQIYSLVQGESGMGRNLLQSNQYAGYFQLGKNEAYGSMGITKEQFANLPFNEQMDAYTRWAQRNDPSGEQLRNLGLFNAASNINLQTQPDETVVYGAGSAAARQNPTWERGSHAGGAVTIGGIKSYYGENDAEINRQLAAVGSPIGMSSATSVSTGATPKGWPIYNQVYQPGGNPAAAVDKIMALEGLRKVNPEDLTKIRQFLRDGGQSLDPATASFCAATVNSALVQSGMKPLNTNKDVATQFATRQGLEETGGQIISSPGNYHPDQIQKGDVSVYTFGAPLGSQGGHVGMAAGPYDTNAGTFPFMSANTSMPPFKGAGNVHLNPANPKSMYIIRLPQGDSRTWDERFPKGAWNPRPDQAITSKSPGRMAMPSSLQSQISSDRGNIDLSQPGLTSIPGIGDMMTAGAAHKPEPAPPKPVGAPSTKTEPAPATGAGQQPKGLRLGHGKASYAWHPGQGGQTNVPGTAQEPRRQRNLAAVQAMHPRWWAAAQSGQMGLGSNPLTDIAGEVGPAAHALAAGVMHPAATLASASGVQDAWNLAQAGLSGVGALWHTTAGRLAAMGTESRASGNVLADVAGAASSLPFVGGASSVLTKGAELLGGTSVAELAGAGMQLGQAGIKAGPLMLGDPDKGIPPAGGLGSPSDIIHKVHGTGTINVNVRAPKGTNVNAESGGLFKKVNLNRGMSMEHADERGHVTQ